VPQNDPESAETAAARRLTPGGSARARYHWLFTPAGFERYLQATGTTGHRSTRPKYLSASAATFSAFDEWLRDYARDRNRWAHVDSGPILIAASPDSAAEPVQLALARFD
jgi:hypothetical protein